MTDQIQQQMTDMVMSEKQTTDSLRMIDKTMNNILTTNYGMKEDKTYLVPTQTSKEGVNTLELRKHKQTDDIHKDIRRVRKLLLKINTNINTVQKTTYQHLITKKRHREYERNKDDHKKQKFKEMTSSRKRQETMNTVKQTTMYDLYSEVTHVDDDDLFDSDPDFS
jgi:hypothetical protein